MVMQSDKSVVTAIQAIDQYGNVIASAANPKLIFQMMQMQGL